MDDRLRSGGGAVAGATHAVQFYEEAEFLIDAVADFVVDGLGRGIPALVIARPGHRDGLAAALLARGCDVDALVEARRLLLADARETLHALMVGDTPDDALFQRVIGELLGGVRGGARGVRAFGEMVDLLWADGNAAAVERLEALWNQLLADGRVELLCAYGMQGFAEAADAEAFAAICGAHDHVRPTESYSRASDASRLVQISSLQQRAKSLETELRQRALLEQQLRNALDERERLLDEERAARREAERARIVAQEANRAKNTFLAVMSHELRTPLNVIGGYAELLDMEVFGPVTDAQRDAVARLRNSQQHLLGLIDEVLGYTDTESGAARYEISDVPLLPLLESVEAVMVPRFREHGVAYDRPPFDAGLTVRADPGKLRQVLLHLLSNALKFTEAGGRVEVEAIASRSRAMIMVRDTGIGIAREALSQIFEPFLQAESALTRTRGGMGLGLALSRDLARAMHGDLTVESDEGKGSTFILRMPRG